MDTDSTTVKTGSHVHIYEQMSQYSGYHSYFVFLRFQIWVLGCKVAILN